MQVFLSCHSQLISDASAKWERSDGMKMPKEHNVKQGVLHIKSLSKQDEGVYKCIVSQGHHVSESEVALEVDDFVPYLNGRDDSLELPPMSNTQIETIDVLLTLNATGPNGVIFTTSRMDNSYPILKHETYLDNGYVVYEYDIGYGKENVKTENKMLSGWNTISVKNDDIKATVQLNSGEPAERRHGPVRKQPGINTPFYIGGMKDDGKPSINGTISSVYISGEVVDLGLIERTTTLLSYDACSINKPCLNGGICRIANERQGYKCECKQGFDGAQCHRQSNACKDENCNHGICLESDDTWQCVCPANATGIRCEDELSPPISSPSFLYETSFISLPSPKDIDKLSLAMTIIPSETHDEHVLVYMATSYDPTINQYLSASIINDAIEYKYNDGKNVEIVRSGPIQPGKEYKVEIKRDGKNSEVVINGISHHPTIKPKDGVESLLIGTDLFVGGIAPGMSTPVSLPEQSFRGCITAIRVNGKDVSFDDSKQYSSGDISQCGAVVVSSEEDPNPYSPEVTFLPPLEDEEEDKVYTINREEPVPEITTTMESDDQRIIPRPTDKTTTTTTTATTTTTTTTTSTTPIPETTLAEPEDEDEVTDMPIEETTTTTTEEPTTTTVETFVYIHKDPDVEDAITTARPISSTSIKVPRIFDETYQEELKNESGGGVEIIDEEEDKEQTGETTTIDPCTIAKCGVDVCSNHSCGMNGQCQPFNSSHYECICKLYYDGPKCDMFKPIEHAARFDGTAFIEISADEFPHLTSEMDEIVEFKFKTTAQSGIMFWQGQYPGTNIVGEDYFSIGLENGYLHYSYELGGGAAHLVSPHRVNDGIEHKVKLQRQGRRGVLRLDDLDEQRVTSTGILAMLNVDGNIFIGGVPDVYKSTGGLYNSNFSGCIADVALNSEIIDLMGTAIDGKNVKPCDEWIPPKKWLKTRRRTFRQWSML